MTSTKHALTIIGGVVAGLALFVGCANGPTQPAPTAATTSPMPTPTQTAIVQEPPASEDDAIEAAEETMTTWLEVRGEVNAAGGTDTGRLEALAMGRALEFTLNDAASIANGPIVNEDGVSVDGPATTEGAFVYETVSAYGQEYEGVANGLVTVNACQDSSGYSITASDGTPAMRPENARVLVDYQVVYDAERKAWLVYDLVSLQQTC